ncbi:hypothetical protein LCGC14_2510160 [marine sediment metagenome]|uniref:Uncharacterized protein n=1 Tax=marine sediment metagenome TaxID=412755 RepID=A0A0F9DSU3_9ZZZZ
MSEKIEDFKFSNWEDYAKTLKAENEGLKRNYISAVNGRKVFRQLHRDSKTTIQELVIMVNMYRSLPDLSNPDNAEKYNEGFRVRAYLNDKIEELDLVLTQAPPEGARND